MIETVDWAAVEALGALEETGAADQTLAVFTSDLRPPRIGSVASHTLYDPPDAESYAT